MINILANNQIFFNVFLFEKTTKFTHNKLKACNILFCLAKKKKCETGNLKLSLRVVLVFLTSGLKS